MHVCLRPGAVLLGTCAVLSWWPITSQFFPYGSPNRAVCFYRDNITMDPLTAVSLAASILQIIDIGTKVISESVEIYQSATGASSVSEEAETMVDNIKAISGQLRKSLRPNGSHDVLNKYETHLEGLRLRSQDVAQELLDKLASLRVDETNKILRRVKSVGKALKVVLKDKAEVEDLQRRLNAIRDDLEAQVVVDMR